MARSGLPQTIMSLCFIMFVCNRDFKKLEKDVLMYKSCDYFILNCVAHAHAIKESVDSLCRDSADVSYLRCYFTLYFQG